MRWRQGLAEGQGKKADKDGRVEGVAVRVVHGKARLAHGRSRRGDKPINTSVVERHNGPSRLRKQREVRETWALSTATGPYGRTCWLSAGLVRVLSASQQCEHHAGGPGDPIAVRRWQQVWRITCGPPVNGCFGLFSGAEIITGHYLHVCRTYPEMRRIAFLLDNFEDSLSFENPLRLSLVLLVRQDSPVRRRALRSVFPKELLGVLQPELPGRRERRGFGGARRRELHAQRTHAAPAPSRAHAARVRPACPATRWCL